MKTEDLSRFQGRFQIKIGCSNSHSAGRLFSVTQNSMYFPNMRRVCASKAGSALRNTTMNGTKSHSSAKPIRFRRGLCIFFLGRRQRLRMIVVIKAGKAKLKIVPVILGEL